MVTVIVAEGDQDTRGAIGFALADAGYPIVEAATGLTALKEMATRAGPLVAVVDARLPDLDGAEIVRFARSALRPDRPLKVVLLTTDARDARSVRNTRNTRNIHPAVAFAREVAGDPFVQTLVKPFTCDALIDAVRSAEWLMLAGRPTPQEVIYHG